ncbi:hypothetical protein RSK20926_11644 [Roseobacter sp. SK209-2-6]|uniref:hypothetical protein n=1 Tax=Roseobacter sp. SK209-2-6 TaxID=388739 RepID=UPI0000F3C6F9|nr:hypothetical protein [Roseobacter sp. SK209-2-6]EBA18370.1 hypothetical protein RSK20926_11644 [Roseobacter sp. SK209-2-6]
MNKHGSSLPRTDAGTSPGSQRAAGAFPTTHVGGEGSSPGRAPLGRFAGLQSGALMRPARAPLNPLKPIVCAAVALAVAIVVF